MTPLYGIDISSNQGWARGIPYSFLSSLAKNGYKFLFARASIGTDADSRFNVHHDRVTASRPGWAFGAYHYLKDDVDGTAQANTFVASVRAAAKGNTKLDGILCALDCELDRRNGNFPKWAQARDFSDRFRQLVPDHQLIMYSNEDTFASWHNPDATGKFDYLWQARWGYSSPDISPKLPEHPPLANFGGWHTTPLWQWGPIHYKGNIIDGDAFYGELSTLKALGDVQTYVPIPDRPNYAVGWNAALAAELAQIDPAVPVGPGGPAYPAGVADAQDAIAEAIKALRLT